MKFDPLLDYSDTDLSIDENLACWKYGELIKTLITLASCATRQREIIGQIGVATDEIAEDFHTYFTLPCQSYMDNNLLGMKQRKKLDQLDQFFDVRSGDRSPEFWDSSTLELNPEWEYVRQEAQSILQLLCMDDLTLELNREEFYRTTDEGKQLIGESTKTRLVKVKVN